MLSLPLPGGFERRRHIKTRVPPSVEMTCTRSISALTSRSPSPPSVRGTRVAASFPCRRRREDPVLVEARLDEDVAVGVDRMLDRIRRCLPAREHDFLTVVLRDVGICKPVTELLPKLGETVERALQLKREPHGFAFPGKLQG